MRAHGQISKALVAQIKLKTESSHRVYCKSILTYIPMWIYKKSL